MQPKARFWDTRSQTELLLLPVGVPRPILSHDGRALIGYGSRFVFDLGQREAALELGFPAPEGQSEQQRAMQLIEVLTLQHDWASAARALEWTASAGLEVPHLLAARIAWVLGDVSLAASHLRAALESGESEGPSLRIWRRSLEAAVLDAASGSFTRR